MANARRGKLPQPAPHLLSRELDGEFIVLDAEADHAHHLTGDAAIVWRAVVDGEPAPLDGESLSDVVAHLGSLGLLDHEVSSVARRTVMRAGAFGASAAAITGIQTLVLPEAAFALSNDLTFTSTSPGGPYPINIPYYVDTITIDIVGGGGAGGTSFTDATGGSGGTAASFSCAVQLPANRTSGFITLNVYVGGGGSSSGTAGGGWTAGGSAAGASGNGGGGGGSSAVVFGASTAIVVAGGGGGGGAGGTASSGAGGAGGSGGSVDPSTSASAGGSGGRGSGQPNGGNVATGGTTTATTLAVVAGSAQTGGNGSNGTAGSGGVGGAGGVGPHGGGGGGGGWAGGGGADGGSIKATGQAKADASDAGGGGGGGSSMWRSISDFTVLTVSALSPAPTQGAGGPANTPGVAGKVQVSVRTYKP